MFYLLFIARKSLLSKYFLLNCLLNLIVKFNITKIYNEVYGSSYLESDLFNKLI